MAGLVFGASTNIGFAGSVRTGSLTAKIASTALLRAPGTLRPARVAEASKPGAISAPSTAGPVDPGPTSSLLQHVATLRWLLPTPRD